MRALLIALAIAPAVLAAKGKPRTAPKPAVEPPPPLCDGDYADALPVDKANAILDSSREPFVFAIRNIATYEHVYYGRDGKLRRAYLRSIVHGTGFGYRIVGGETHIVTNDHVASQAEVTDEEHAIEGVPVGSKKVREQLKIVRDENDDYEPGHVPLQRLLSDPQADIAVLKAKKQLGVMPYRIGHSAALRPGNLVQARGFPLGAFQALNTGKVLNPMTLDTERGWNHSDFVVDALLNSGSSGSPVFAISCRSAQPELVGVYHAAYTDAAALNAVVAIDQLREELETLKVVKREAAGVHDLTAQDRERFMKRLFEEPTRSLTFPFAGRSVVATLADPHTLRFGILDDDFPLTVHESMALIDRVQNGLGSLDAVAVAVDGIPTEVPARALEADIREHFDRLYESLWRQVLGVVDYRARTSGRHLTADAFAEAQAARQRLLKRAPEQKEILNICVFEADRANFGAARNPAGPQAQPLSTGARPDVVVDKTEPPDR